MFETLKIDINDNIAIIALARPDMMNSYNETMAIELLRAFEQADKDNDVRAILLRGEGRSFCAGGDIAMFADKLDSMPGNVPEMMEVLNTTITTMLSTSKPILASVHGSVAGVGMSLMMACDLVVAAESCKFTMAYAGIGLTPDGGASYLLPRIVGTKKAMQMFLLPDIFSAEKAERMELINWVVDDAELDKQTSSLMYKLANGPTFALKRAKQLLNDSWDRNIEDQLMAEMYAFTECTITKDFARGVSAFLQKQKPVFEGD